MTTADKISLAVVLLLGISLSFATAYITSEFEQENRQLELENRAYVYMSHIRKTLISNMNTLHSIRGVFNASDHVSFKEFSIFSSPILRSHPEIEFLAWAPRVSSGERQQHEAEVIRSGMLNYQIRERALLGGFKPSVKRDEYFPALYINPERVIQSYLGFDFSSNTMFSRHMQETVDLTTPVATAPINLDLRSRFSEEPDFATQFGLLVFLAVYDTPRELVELSQRREHLQGYVVAFYRLADLFEKAVQDFEASLSVYVEDITQADNPREVFRSAINTGNPRVAGKYRGEVKDAEFRYQEVLDIAGRQWRFYIDFNQKSQSLFEWLSVIVFSAGILFTGFLAAYVIGNSKRRSIIEDLIDERTAELRAVSDQVQQVLDNTGEGICGIDLHGNTTFVNQAALSITGYNEEDFLYCHQHSLIHHHYLDGRAYPEEECKINQAFTQGKTTTVEDEVFWHKDGYGIPVEYTATPMRDEAGDIHGAVVTFRDIRRRKQYEEQLIEARNHAEMASSAKTTFLATMSHEIRTPMNGMLGMAQLLEKTSLDEKQSQYIKTLMHSGKALLEQINDILDFSRIEAGKLHLENNPFDLRVLCQDLVHLMENSAEAKGLYLKLNYADNCPSYFLGDKLRIRQVLLNLIGNAIKFTAQGGVQLNVTSHGVRASRMRLQLEVKDTGIGIPEDKRQHLFDSFSQVDASTTRKYGGSGLGLAISRQLAELMDGDISVASEQDSGSSFTLRMALPETMEAAMELSTELEQLRFEGRVLLVEDNFVNQQVAEAMLSHLGLEVTIAENGAVALEKCQQNEFDLILMDCQMPIMDGYTATQEIRQLNHGERVPILALTANVLPEDLQRCIEAGMNACLHKPIEADVLQNSLKEWLPFDVYEAIQEEPGEDPMTTPDDVSSYVNLETLNTLSDLMGEVFDQLIPSYIDASDKCFNEAEAYIEQQDLETVERMFHSLKSSSRNLGAMALGDYAEKLEAAMRDKQPENLQPDFNAAKDMYQQVRQILLDFQANRGA